MLIGWPLAARPYGTGRLIESSPLKVPEKRVSQKNCWPSCSAAALPKYLFDVSTGGASGRPDSAARRDCIVVGPAAVAVGAERVVERAAPGDRQSRHGQRSAAPNRALLAISPYASPIVDSGRFAAQLVAEQQLHQAGGLGLDAVDVRRQILRELGGALVALRRVDRQRAREDLRRRSRQLIDRLPVLGRRAASPPCRARRDRCRPRRAAARSGSST